MNFIVDLALAPKTELTLALLPFFNFIFEFVTYERDQWNNNRKTKYNRQTRKIGRH